LLLELGKREKTLLAQVLNLYPRVPSAHLQPGKPGAGPGLEATQRLLNEALAEQRAENRKQLDALLSDEHRWTQTEMGWKLTLSPGDAEWLLQILNDIRVGSWVLLGSPEERFEVVNQETAPHLWAMEIAGSFQIALLEAMESET
jgi:hypothetical protein